MSISANGRLSRNAVWPGPADFALLPVFALAMLILSPVGAGVAAIAAFSVIGIPLYLLMAATPGLCLLYAFWRLSLLIWRAWSGGAFVAAAVYGVLLGLLANWVVLSAWRDMWTTQHEAQQIVQGDFDRIVSPPRPSRLVIATQPSRERDNPLECDDLCQRLLASGSVKEVIVASLPQRAREAASRAYAMRLGRAGLPELQLDPQAPAVRYRLVQQGNCDNRTIVTNVRRLSMPGGAAPEGSASEALRLRAAAGQCLVAATARAGDGEAALVYGVLAHGYSAYEAAGIEDAMTAQAWRVHYLRRRAADFEEIHRASGVRYLQFPGARVPGYVHDNWLKFSGGFLRLSRELGMAQSGAAGPDIAGFVQNRLGLSLRIDREALAGRQRDTIDAMLKGRGAVSNDVVRDYAGAMRASNASASAQEAQRILGVAADANIALPADFAELAKLVVRDAPEQVPLLARHLVVRLEAIPDAPPPPAAAEAWTRAVTATARAVAVLPDGEVRAHRAPVERFARTPVKRDLGQQLVRRLGIFGAAGMPLAFELIDAGLSEIASQPLRPEDRGTYRYARGSGVKSGLALLCRFEKDAQAALPQLAARIERMDGAQRQALASDILRVIAKAGGNELQAREMLRVDSGDAGFVRRWDAANSQGCD